MPYADVEVIVSYGNAAYTLTKEITGNGTVDFVVNGAPSDGTNIPNGTRVDLVIKPADGNAMAEAKIGTEYVKSDANGYYVVMPQSDAKVTVAFGTANYTIKFKGFAEGSETPSFDINGAAEPKISLDSPIKATVAGDYVLESVIASYKGADGNDVTDNMTVTKSDSEPGVYFLKLNNVPANGADIFVTTMFSKVKASYSIKNVSTVDAADAEIFFYNSDNKETRTEISEALDGSKVYGEIIVNKYDKSIKNDKITWNGGTGSAPVEFDKLDGGKAVYKFSFTIDKDVEVNYQLDAAKVTFAYDNTRASVAGPVPIGAEFVVSVKPDTVYGREIADVYLAYTDGNGTQTPRCLSRTGNDFTFKISTVPMNGSGYPNFVQLVVLYAGE